MSYKTDEELGINPFDSLLGKKKNPHKQGTRDSKGRFLAGPPVGSHTKRVMTLKSRQKGEPQTPYMNLSGRINWLVRMISQLSMIAYISELRKHPARTEMIHADQLRLIALEDRAIKLCHEANELASEIAQFNKTKTKKRG